MTKESKYAKCDICEAACVNQAPTILVVDRCQVLYQERRDLLQENAKQEDVR